MIRSLMLTASAVLMAVTAGAASAAPIATPPAYGQLVSKVRNDRYNREYYPGYSTQYNHRHWDYPRYAYNNHGHHRHWEHGQWRYW